MTADQIEKFAKDLGVDTSKVDLYIAGGRGTRKKVASLGIEVVGEEKGKAIYGLTLSEK